MAWTVSGIAKLAGVSVRTLHHYDELGLVRPSGRTEGGYRLYGQADLERLEQVLYFRELGFPLDEIARLLDAPTFDRRSALQMQRRLLVERAARTDALIGAVDRALEALQKGREMSKEEMFQVFGTFDPKKHEQEAQQRWGDSPEFKESRRRTKGYTKADWVRIQAEAKEIYEAMGRLMSAGAEATDAEATRLAEQHRLHIDKAFYPCSHDMHRMLGEMYVQDPRFAETYERIRPGLSVFMRDAIVANAEHPYVAPETKVETKQKQHLRRK